ncbi:hypothetical protein OCC_13630 [Thermococcus litoralis DSM 5473]|uniref:Uncharacterized protein n=1 Tax=Thermococcus litoralis (strain ATCC 51850 / DSM 5473 / JCM 8560 / NS-C) TaxID=523849 RepID=S5ZAX7_THELN|nr:hypothetical protein OCC_13630 [Thermococcus litoralis DSM 5473]
MHEFLREHPDVLRDEIREFVEESFKGRVV